MLLFDFFRCAFTRRHADALPAAAMPAAAGKRRCCAMLPLALRRHAAIAALPRFADDAAMPPFSLPRCLPSY